MGKKKRLRKLLFVKKAQLKAAQAHATPPGANMVPTQTEAEEKPKAKAKKTSKKRSTKKRSS